MLSNIVHGASLARRQNPIAG